MIGSLYRPGSSLLHRAPVGAKLACLALVGTLLFWKPSLAASLAALVVALALFPLSRLPFGAAWVAVRALLPLAVLIGAVQVWIAGPLEAALVVSRLLALFLLAGIVTATTRVWAMTETIERALFFLRFVGVDPARVGLAISLAIRFIPVIGVVMQDVREAQAARGLERSVFAMAVPLILRTLRMADEIAEAIDARS
ncbi:energy-coupling factor transporter transmembrane protein EcfT [Aureimonas sp. ME7]|uniref:energy-coupling factor transporter transmembrane component T family protein n=1 Tax=Aureimonas sp. ME7 TaxID=2744252 RepID=UPI0015F59BBC|nr:energy-coupling factor transporter transmembrane protein EcfT [Aureimonas sp. ME7]